ncbi:acyl-CoA synthetase [Dethiosulfatarculus sandiegensis]|uniref:O-succinylbenzoate-CoA ligase n=1 Tax=Dethiosulfatarculus sandiegensis TaxID=1429043 RepID=A0A0D2JEV2_9BACT|nr:long-chain fatty acid--CoA ligase [Dethiosulfatarculus sandiegensis]KIX14196.1 O-succinylbenzoate-CoA ligase [Dethiosulfatarculus sandiegensis]
MNAALLLANQAAKSPSATALIQDQQRISYQQLEKRTGHLAGALLAAGLNPGDRVALLFHNCPALVEVYFAAIRVGLVATPVNFRLVGREMAHILNDSGAKALFMGAEFAETIATIEEDLEEHPLFVTQGKQHHLDSLDYDDFVEKGSYSPFSEDIKEDQPCQLMYTSGTTGRPKGAVISHRNIIWNLFNTIHGREDKEGQISIIVGPLYHTAALNNHLTIQLALGGVSILVKKFEPGQMLKIIEKEKATVISGSPAMYNLLLQHPKAAQADTRSIEKCTSGADKLPLATKKRLMEFLPGIHGIYDVYGCTEASPCITILKAKDSLIKDVSVGTALPFLQAVVADEDSNPLPPGEVGELICRGPNVMAGYHNQPRATEEALRQGWLHTGDLARMDQDGFFYIVDRKKDMIVSGGENIYPREVEEVLFAHPDVADVAVVGIPDEMWGESVKAFLVLRNGKELSSEEVIEYCKRHLASYKKPKLVQFIKDMPRNASGKTLKNRLRKWGE